MTSALKRFSEKCTGQRIQSSPRNTKQDAAGHLKGVPLSKVYAAQSISLTQPLTSMRTLLLCGVFAPFRPNQGVPPMNTREIKETLSTIGYPVKGSEPEEVLVELHSQIGSIRVGSSISQLGDAKPLFVIAGNVAHLVDCPQDLHRACLQIRQRLKERESQKLIIIKKDVLSRHLPEITRHVELEIDMTQRLKRPTPLTDKHYSIIYDPEARTQVRKGQQIIDDLLSADAKSNQKALACLKELLIIERGEE